MKISTYIFVHDQNMILDFLQAKKFKEFHNVTYVFVGGLDCTLIENESNVIIARNLKYNLEQYPRMTAFTGWYALWKNKLIPSDTDYIHLFEYDINVLPNISDICKFFMNDDPDLLGYITLPIDDICYLHSVQYVNTLLDSLKRIYNIDYVEFLKVYREMNPKIDKVVVTSNITFSYKCFHEYMSWIEPIITDIKDDDFCGHQLERSISAFIFLFDKKIYYLENVITHFQIDSHQTQAMYASRIDRYYPRLLTQDNMSLA